MSDVHAALTRAHREEWARVVATLTKRFGNLDNAGDAAAEAFATAAEHWPVNGRRLRPHSPYSWVSLLESR